MKFLFLSGQIGVGGCDAFMPLCSHTHKIPAYQRPQHVNINQLAAAAIYHVSPLLAVTSV